VLQVLHRVLSPGVRRQNILSSRTPYSLTKTTSRTRNRHQLINPKRCRRATLNRSDCEDNSSDEEEFTQVRQWEITRICLLIFSVQSFVVTLFMYLQSWPILDLIPSCGRSFNICYFFAYYPFFTFQRINKRLRSSIVPQFNTKLQANLDRVYQDAEKLKSKFLLLARSAYLRFWKNVRRRRLQESNRGPPRSFCHPFRVAPPENWTASCVAACSGNPSPRRAVTRIAGCAWTAVWIIPRPALCASHRWSM